MSKFHCIHCGQRIEAPAEMAGSESNCPACGGAIQVPDFVPVKPPSLPAKPPALPVQKAGQARTKKSAVSVIVTIIIFTAVILLARTCGSVVGRETAERHYAEHKSKKDAELIPSISLENALEDFAKQANEKLPKMTDRITRAESVVIENGNTLVEKYTIITHTKGELDIPYLKDYMNKLMRSQINSTTETKLLLDRGVKWVWRYYDKNGSFIFSINNSQLPY